jgi:hypothetical protein
VVLQYISTDKQIADILIKPLSKMKKFAYLRDKLGSHGDDFLNGKGSDYSQVGREH